MSEIGVTRDGCSRFPGGWSMPSDEMYEALRAASYTGTLRVLELGSGAGTAILADLLRNKGTPFSYVSYENRRQYIVEDPNVVTVFWTTFPSVLYKGPFDLVIIDGPNGVVRKDWYPLLKPQVKEGTILAIDDFGHYPEFAQALDENFSYTTVAEFEPFTRRGVTWKVARIDHVK